MRLSKRGFSYTINTLGVVGAGQMGTGIALVGARYAKLRVKVVDMSEDQLKSSEMFMHKLLKKEIAKGRLTEADIDDIIPRISFSTSYDDYKDVDFVVEAVSESEKIKRSVFQELGRSTPKHAILASNTSSISITKIAGFVDRPDKVIGCHFMNPVPVMKLVEVIRGLQTSEETLTATTTLIEAMGKVAAKSEDRPGFVINRVLMPMINEAIIALQDGVATRDDIDVGMKLGTGVPMGPLQLADFIGLDTCLAIMNVLHQGFGDSKYRPAPLLQQYVDAGLLGKKSGAGFYIYN